MDARFEDAADRPLRLRALDAEDLAVVSALAQDGVLPVAEIAWARRQRRLACLLNRFRWEAGTRRPERVRSVLTVENVTAVRSQGIDPRARDTVLSLLSIGWEPGPDGAGRVVLTLAGDGAIAAEVEALEVLLHDATRPYLAPSRRVPSHPE
jgi:hypothetical protein